MTFQFCNYEPFRQYLKKSLLLMGRDRKNHAAPHSFMMSMIPSMPMLERLLL